MPIKRSCMVSTIVMDTHAWRAAHLRRREQNRGAVDAQFIVPEEDFHYHLEYGLFAALHLRRLGPRCVVLLLLLRLAVYRLALRQLPEENNPKRWACNCFWTLLLVLLSKCPRHVMTSPCRSLMLYMLSILRDRSTPASNFAFEAFAQSVPSTRRLLPFRKCTDRAHVADLDVW